MHEKLSVNEYIKLILLLHSSCKNWESMYGEMTNIFFFVKYYAYCVSECIHIMEIIVAINDGSDCVFEILAAFDININY
jgi:hypothetical protein